MAAPVAHAEFPIGGQLRISFMEADGDPAFGATRPDVAYDSSRDRYMLVWQGKRSDTEGPEIYGQLVGRSHVRTGPNFKISSTPGTSASAEPRVTYNRVRDEFLVVWAAKRSPTAAQEIYAQRLAPNGNEVGEDDFPLSSTGQAGASFEASAPNLAYNSASDTYLTVWSSDDQADGEYEIYGQMLSGTGTAFGLDDFRVSTMGADGSVLFGAFDPAVAYDSVNSRFLVAWSGDDVVDGEREIYTRLYDGNGSSPTGQTRISHMGPDGDKNFDAFAPSLAFNPTTGEYPLVWRGEEAGHDQEFEVYAQRLNSGGGEVGATDFRVSDMGPDGSSAYAVEGSPTVEYLSVSNRYLVLWHGDDNTPPLLDGEMEVFGQTLGAGGQELGVNDFRVTNYGPPGDATADAELPQAAYNPQANQTLVVWQGRGASPLAPTEFEIFSRRVGEDRDGDGVVDGDDLCATVPAGPFDADGDGCPDDRDSDGISDELDRCPSMARGAIDKNGDGCPDDSDGDGVPDERDRCPTTPAGRLDRNRNGCPGRFGSVDGARLSTSVLDYRSYIVVESLKFRDLPLAKATVTLRCVRGCKTRERLIKRAGRRTVASRRFRGRRLRAGAVIRATITSRDVIGTVRRYTVRGGDLREVRSARMCIPVGARKARKSCDRGR